MNEVFKFNEDVVAKEVVDYIGSTYHAHYAGKEGLQTCLLYTSDAADE